MTTTAPTLEDLQAQRATVLDQIDDILRTAQARAGEGNPAALEDAERAQHDTLAEQATQLEAEIGRAVLARQDAARFANAEARRQFTVPMVNLITTPPAHANRTLDELFWAAQPEVVAGSFARTGQFVPNTYGARTAVEPAVLRTSEAGEPLYAPTLDEFRPEQVQAIRRFQRTATDMILFGLMADKKSHSSADAFEFARSHRIFKARWAEALRAMDIDTSGEGGTWVPTGIGAVLHEKVRAAGKVGPLFARINLPTNPWKWPVEGADATAYRVAEPTGDSESKMTASTPGTVAATFDAEIFGARVLTSKFLEADSAVAILPYVTGKVAQAFVDAEEKAILDGDSDGTHQDSDVGASTTDVRSAWDGLRKRALANASAATTTTTVANLLAIRALMGKWGVNPSDLAYIVGVSALHDLIADSNLLTVDKMGPQATILNGMIGSVAGVPVIVSEHMRENLNASGVYDGITTTKTVNLCVNRGEWAMGQRQALDVEANDSIYAETAQRVIIGFMREDFQSIGDASSNDDTAIGYNVTP